MTTLIVGGDRINTYKNYLLAQGFGPVLHWSGRKSSECHRTIPTGTSLVVIMVDQVNHGLATKTRRTADELDVPVVFSIRSISQLDQALAHLRNNVISHTSLQ